MLTYKFIEMLFERDPELVETLRKIIWTVKVTREQIKFLISPDAIITILVLAFSIWFWVKITGKPLMKLLRVGKRAEKLIKKAIDTDCVVDAVLVNSWTKNRADDDSHPHYEQIAVFRYVDKFGKEHLYKTNYEGAVPHVYRLYYDEDKPSRVVHSVESSPGYWLYQYFRRVIVIFLVIFTYYLLINLARYVGIITLEI